jgi:hypothetical protein
MQRDPRDRRSCRRQRPVVLNAGSSTQKGPTPDRCPRCSQAHGSGGRPRRLPGIRDGTKRGQASRSPRPHGQNRNPRTSQENSHIVTEGINRWGPGNQVPGRSIRRLSAYVSARGKGVCLCLASICDFRGENLDRHLVHLLTYDVAGGRLRAHAPFVADEALLTMKQIAREVGPLPSRRG